MDNGTRLGSCNEAVRIWEDTLADAWRTPLHGYSRQLRHDIYEGGQDHPDMVGFYSPVEDWNDKLLEFNKATDRTAIRLYAFELKKHIDRGSYRENFFQAVSNSSWANEGYLVACSFQQQDDLLSELERLSASFGIGIITFDLDDIDSSKVLFPARTKETIWTGRR
jgi:hypothetical protein